jgi:outer membrane receptor protein involved in Fe transport
VREARRDLDVVRRIGQQIRPTRRDDIMNKGRSKGLAHCQVSQHAGFPAAASIATAVSFALYGLAQPAAAQSADQAPDALQEITVTATRREQSLEAVPYSMSVISAAQIEASGATDIATLATQVPGLSMYDYGARFAGATAPIIRGINATGSPARGFRTFEQDPVGTYIRPSMDTFSWTI